MKKIKKENQLLNKINEYLKIKDIGNIISDSTDLIMRLNLGQMSIVIDILKGYCDLYRDGKGPDVKSALYKANELGEYIKCYQQYGDCEYVNDCWPTRKGFCKKKENKNKKNLYDTKEYRSVCCNAKVEVVGPLPDFIGDKNPKIGTCYYKCMKCGEPCNWTEGKKK
ncbi:MAG: hypothetical protein PHP92_04085 [Candidatus Nanoarchaeia archaeon]|nr:hypothetical protein [Candidatus Nanoarchaeia archaeon]